nr:MAG TPA: hypothetical protein [Caudoviricetes sp.]
MNLEKKLIVDMLMLNQYQVVLNMKNNINML